MGTGLCRKVVASSSLVVREKVLRYVGAGDDISSGAVKPRIVSKRRLVTESWGPRILAGDPSLYSEG